MLNNVRIAAVAVDTQPGNLSDNLRKIAYWTKKAAAAGANLILFQELSLSGFIPNHPTGDHDKWVREALQVGRKIAEPVNGPAVRQLSQIAAESEVLISAGMFEDAGNVLHNTQVLVGGKGLLGSWRKMHVPMYEMPFYCGGGVPDVVDTPLGRVGVNICFDVLLPESTRLLAVKNAEIALFPFAADPPPVTPQGWANWASLPIRSRCAENGIYGVACNYVGTVTCAGVSQSFPGGGIIVDPRGQIMTEWTAASGEPGMLISDLSAEVLREARAEPEYLYRFRRPELYGSLANIS
ncbi:carbon-nitrogen hydrolase family protein [Schlesneria paludicola]|uniref:carbon-nitrogen hydrolase family protein n=1 Tax=Schlesneria paludicola TaxID=360056 RepID=UPI00029A8E82|nr:carbon-nitrogen hydrolase family protein [Schlesneria paludicola]